MRTEQGAEATVEIGDEKVLKKRKPKKYRHPELDQKIREERTETEKELIQKASKYGVNTPKIRKENISTLEMEKIEGESLKKVAGSEKEVFEKMGENVARLHSTGIIHGDLTTSNALISGEKVFLLDFGLSFQSDRTEDKAVDIHLLKQVLESSHPEVAEKAWENFLKGYKDLEESEEVLKQLEEVEKRGRYK
ncbi:MAG: KEOPS complex kinase/ATPase Bud32 [Candidatus Nanohalobium sp.]